MRASYSERMASKIGRILGLAGLAFVVAWWGRLKAHSKTPPPEGHWREVGEEELSHNK
jgi:hypothetical protein